VSSQIVFEHPLNERMRTFLRLEHLFEKIGHFMPQYDPWATRVAVEALIDVAGLTARADLKNEIQKEIERNLATLEALASQPGVDPGSLERVLGDLRGASAGIQGMAQPIGQGAREDELLKAVAQRASLPGGACSFDLPAHHRWLIQSPEERQGRLEQWLSDLRPAERAISLVLRLIRTSANPREVIAPEGFYQQSLDNNAPAQLIRLGLPGDAGIFPEVSGHKTRFSVRFMRMEPKGRPVPVAGDVPFRLTCCIL
jgi:cell division protein ZapD